MPDKVHRDRNRQTPTLVDLPPVELESNVAVKEPRHESDAEKRDQMDRSDFDRDLRPNEFAGTHQRTAFSNVKTRSAYDIKELHEKYPQFTNAELKAINVLPIGARLEQGATYLDLRHCDRGEFKARADLVAGEDNFFVAKSGLDYLLWGRLCSKKSAVQ